MDPWRYSTGGVSVALRVTPRGGRDDIDGLETLANGRSCGQGAGPRHRRRRRGQSRGHRADGEGARGAQGEVRILSGATSRLKQIAVDGDPRKARRCVAKAHRGKADSTADKGSR